MGQYYVIANIDKKQYLHPHRCGDGLKLLEFGLSGDGTMACLAILLADGNGRGGGDLTSRDYDRPEDVPEHMEIVSDFTITDKRYIIAAPKIAGSWAGDRIVIAGDYADGGKFLDGVPREELQAIADEAFTEGNQEAEGVSLYHYAHEKFEDVSEQAILALMEDSYYRQQVTARLRSSRWHWNGTPEAIRERAGVTEAPDA